MDYIRETIDTLKDHVKYKDSIRNLTEEIEKIDAELKGSGINYSEMGMPKGNYSEPGDNWINKICRITQARQERSMSMKEISRIEKILQQMDENSDCENFSAVLRMSFIERSKNNDVERIAAEIGYSKRQYYRIRDRALRTMAILMFGVKANR